MKLVKCLPLSFVVGRIFPPTLFPEWNFTPTGFSTIRWNKEEYFLKRHCSHCNWNRANFQKMKLYIYWELATSLNMWQNEIYVCVKFSYHSHITHHSVTFSCHSHNRPKHVTFSCHRNTTPHSVIFSCHSLTIKHSDIFSCHSHNIPHYVTFRCHRHTIPHT